MLGEVRVPAAAGAGGRPAAARPVQHLVVVVHLLQVLLLLL